MLVRCSLVLLALNCVGIGSTKYVFEDGYDNNAAHFGQKYSFWPSFHNAAKLMRIHKRAAQAPAASLAQTLDKPVGQPEDQPRLSEGGPLVSPESEKNSQTVETANASGIIPPVHASTTIPPVLPDKKGETGDAQESATKAPLPPAQSTPSSNSTVTVTPGNMTVTNNTNTMHAEGAPSAHNITPGVVRRAVIVFSGFLLLAVAYLIFYRKKGDKNNGNTNAMADSNQFRYGVLESEDRQSSMEQSRIPLTMESDEDEDEDLEIFDLGQKKSQSYVNLPAKDEDVVFNNTENRSDNDQLLLEIEDGPSDTLINWSSNGDNGTSSI